MSRRQRRVAQQLELLGMLGMTGLPTPLSRATARRSKHVEAPAPRPWLCAVLAVDTAARSGWAFGIAGKHSGSGECNTLDDAVVELVVQRCVERAAEHDLPLVLVLEAPWGGRASIVAALGAARERWLRVWRALAQPQSHVVLVMPSVWRGPVLGAEWVSAPRDEVRAHEQRSAAALVGYPVGADEAPAILIARWAAHAARVGKAIGKRASRASLRAWTERARCETTR